MRLMSLTGDSKVSVSTVKAIPAFWMAVSREIAIIYRVRLYLVLKSPARLFPIYYLLSSLSEDLGQQGTRAVAEKS